MNIRQSKDSEKFRHNQNTEISRERLRADEDSLVNKRSLPQISSL